MFINPQMDWKAQAGSGRAVLLAPPFPFQARIWKDVVSRLRFPVLTVDTPGFVGGEISLPVPFRLEAYADEIARCVQEAGVKELVACGNSLGGYAVLALAERHPLLVRGMALVGTNADSDPVSVRENRLRMAALAGDGEQAALLAEGVGELFSPRSLEKYPQLAEMAMKWAWFDSPPAGIEWAQRAMAARGSRLEVLRSLRGLPARVLRGDDDAKSTISQARMMATALGCPLVEVPHAGHLLPLEAPGHVAGALGEVWQEAFNA